MDEIIDHIHLPILTRLCSTPTKVKDATKFQLYVFIRIRRPLLIYGFQDLPVCGNIGYKNMWLPNFLEQEDIGT